MALLDLGKTDLRWRMFTGVYICHERSRFFQIKSLILAQNER